MLRVALRRILWAIPTLLGISLVVFLVATLIPDPAATTLAPALESAEDDRSAEEILIERRRAHFLDLPRFVNPHPRDVESRATTDVHRILDALARGRTGDESARDLVRLGGAALPYVLPELDKRAPVERGAVAVALAPIAERMGFTGVRFDDPAEAARFWARYWEDRTVDFTPASVRRAVHRIALGETVLRDRDILEVDTYALADLIDAITDTTDKRTLARLTGLASHVSGRRVVLPDGASDATTRRIKGDWQEWWFVHREDYVALDGTARVFARFADTRYGKWLERSAKGRLGVSSRDGEPIVDKLARRAPITLSLTWVSLVLSYALAIPLGVAAAIRRGQAVDLLLAALLFALYALPTFWVAELLAHIVTGPAGRTPLAPLGPPRAIYTRTTFILAAIALSVSSMALLSRFQRASMLDVLRQDYIRTAHAKGIGHVRIVVVHALRNALMPMVALAGLQLPTSFGGAFVVEEVFGLPGMGYETLRAVEAHDAAWLTTVLLVLSVVAMAGLIVTDLAVGALDTRVRDVMLARAGDGRT
jgi:peptide/nickel transport system permease protein